MYELLLKLLRLNKGMRQLSEFEVVVTTGQIPKGFMSYCYKLLNRVHRGKNELQRRWQEEFYCVMESSNWQLWYNLGIKLSCNINIRENTFKMYSRWHLTPAWLSKIYGGRGQCWQCQAPRLGPGISGGSVVKSEHFEGLLLNRFM